VRLRRSRQSQMRVSVQNAYEWRGNKLLARLRFAGDQNAGIGGRDFR
jgi:hypothetical protein